MLEQTRPIWTTWDITDDEAFALANGPLTSDPAFSALDPGATFIPVDVLAGKVKRAPRIWQKLGLEWLYRVVQEPRRLWKRYAVTNTIFIWMLIKAMPGAWLTRKNAGEPVVAAAAAPRSPSSPGNELVTQESAR